MPLPIQLVKKASILCLGLFPFLSGDNISHAQSRGLVTSAACPFSCRTQGIPKKICRDWREGNTCYIEDLSKPPAPSPSRPQNNNSNEESDSVPAECSNLSRHSISPPRVDINRVRPSGNVFGDKLKISGSVEGVCISEAGLFENGHLEKKIPIVTTKSFKRFEFELTSHGSDDPEIRVYNVNGDRDIVPVGTDDDLEPTDRDYYRR